MVPTRDSGPPGRMLGRSLRRPSRAPPARGEPGVPPGPRGFVAPERSEGVLIGGKREHAATRRATLVAQAYPHGEGYGERVFSGDSAGVAFLGGVYDGGI